MALTSPRSRRPTCAPILFLLVASASGARYGALHTSAKSFRDCCSSKDVDVGKLLAATKAYCVLISRFGKFVGPSISNVRQCMEKVEAAQKQLCTGSRRSLRSVSNLLAAERESGMHKPGGVLADPSAAMGLLWLRRGLEYWADVFEQEAAALKAASKRQNKPTPAPSLVAQCEAAYNRLLVPFHGWVSRRAFALALGLTPDWRDVRACAGLSTSDDELRSELSLLASELRSLCGRLRRLHVQLDLEDKRRSI